MDDKDIKIINKLIKRISRKSKIALDQLYHITIDTFYDLLMQYFEDDDRYVLDALSNIYLAISLKSRFFCKESNGYTWLCNLVEDEAKACLKLINEQKAYPSC